MPPSARRPAGGSTSPASRQRWWSSLAHPQLLLLCALLAIVVIALTAWSYAEIRHSLIAQTKARIAVSANEVEDIFAKAAATSLASTQALAKDKAIVQLAGQPDDESRRAVEELLRNRSRRNAQPSVTEVWSADGTLLLRVELPVVADGAATPELHKGEALAPRGEGIQPMRVCGSGMATDVVAAVRSSGDDPRMLGFVVQRRNLSGAPAVALLGRLIGPNAVLLIGNADGGLWTDLAKPVPAPPLAQITAGTEYRNESGSLRIGAMTPIGDTPWTLVVESDASETLAPADQLLMRVAVVSLAILLLGIVGASWISRRFTRPLREATEAAEAMAAGRLEQRLQQVGPSEVRRLAGAFNVMAERVEEARRDLEARVVQRTTDLERALQQLRDTQDSLVRKEKLAILGQLAGGVGHELRNPLGVMTNVVFYLEMVLPDAPGQVREYLGILRNQINLSGKIITDLLDFSRSRTPVTETVRLEQLAETQLSRSAPVAQVVRDFDTNIPPAQVDPVHAGQILHNLLVNATQAMGESGGTLTLRTRRHGEAHVRLEVADSGPGVPAELRERIFEPLFTTKARGIGLGLAVSRQLAAMNGGELQLANQPGAGATFWFVLPAATAS